MNNTTFLSALNALEQAEDYPSLIEAFRPVQEHFGLSSFLCVRLTNACGAPDYSTRETMDICRMKGSRILTSTQPGGPVLATTANPQWMQTYIDHNSVVSDPVLWYGMYCTRPFLWDLSFRHPAIPEIRQKAVLEDAEAFGVRGGMIWPIHEPGQQFGIVSCFAEGSGQRLHTTLARESDTLINLLIPQLYQRCVQLVEKSRSPAANVHFSRREKDVLHWSAQGKSAWEVAQILSISERTVRFHLARVENRLGACNRQQAITAFIDQEWNTIVEPNPSSTAPLIESREAGGACVRDRRPAAKPVLS